MNAGPSKLKIFNNKSHVNTVERNDFFEPVISLLLQILRPHWYLGPTCNSLYAKLDHLLNLEQ